MKPLEAVLADWRGSAAVLRHEGIGAQADLLERHADEVAAAARDYLIFVDEREAQLHSGRSRAWLRQRFAAWERAGHAKRDGRRRFYRLMIVPRRADVAGAREAGRRAAEAA